MPLVLFEKLTSHVAKITLNDADSLNAMGESMADEFGALTARLKANRDSDKLRVIILTGAGRAFSAGGDLSMLKAKTKVSEQENFDRMVAFYNSFLGILDLNIPLIAAINGAAVGAGLCLACACDIRVAAPVAKLGFSFVKLGLHPGMGATYFLPKVLGDSIARELLLTGRIIDAERALTIGLVSKLSPDNNIMTTAMDVAEEIVGNGPFAVRQLLKSLREPKHDLTSALRHEAQCQAKNYINEEFLEGVTAAVEKRKPKF